MNSDIQTACRHGRKSLRRLLPLASLALTPGVLAAAPQNALGHELAFEAWAEEVQPLVGHSGALIPFARYVDHDVLGIRMEYSTTYRGEKVTASGLVVFPMASEQPAPILIWNHGTIFDESSGPSNWKTAVQLQLIPALNGMIVFMPDYIGYGASEALIHPYVLRDDIVPSVVDMVHAGRQVLESEGVPFNDELYIWGFSEGGYVALATAHAIDTNPAYALDVTEVHAVSGPYDLLQTSSLILSDPTYPIPSYVAFLFAAYNDRYWKRPLTDFFVEPFATEVARFQSRDTRLGALIGSMPATLGELVSPAYIERFEGDGESDVEAMLDANTVEPWVPDAPVFLYHGTADRDVPFAIGKRQFERMLAAGADSEHLSFTAYEGADHSATVIAAMRSFMARR